MLHNMLTSLLWSASARQRKLDEWGPQISFRSLAGASALMVMMVATTEAGQIAPVAAKPAIEKSEAVRRARDELLTGYALVGSQKVPPQEYVFSSAKFESDEKGVGHWEVNFTHPAHTDHTAMYWVYMDGAVVIYDSRPHPDDLAPTQDCDMEDYADQLSLSLCSGHNSDRIDRELNSVYREKMSRFNQESSRTELRNSERKWIKARDKECAEEVGPREEGGTSWPMLINDCFLRKSVARIEFLRLCTDSGCPMKQQ
jgi:uncharacterized protein YecT (DUF1311 family)